MSAAQQNNNYVHTSVQGFCRRGKALLEANPPAQADFVKYMLSGLDGDLRVVVNPMEDRLEDDESITLRRDIDSLLGIEEDICVDRDLTVYPIPRKEDTLTKNIHIESQFTSVKVCTAFYFRPFFLTHDISRERSRLQSTKSRTSASQNGIHTP